MSNSNAICWFEIYVDDLDRARTFYSSVLGVTLEDMTAPDGADIRMAMFPSDPDPATMAVGGALIQQAGARTGGSPSTSTIVYFPCNDCKVEESRVAPAGGTVFKPKFSIGNDGYCTICLDTEGNVFGLYSMQ